MYRRAAIVALFLQAVLRAAPQQRPPDSAPEPIILKSTSRAVQLDVFVDDPSGRPVHGLQKNDFVVTDNGHRRDIRIFAGEIDANQTAPSSAPPPGVYSNRLGIRDSRIVTAIVLDAVPRPEGLQNNPGIASGLRPEAGPNIARWDAISAINRMAPGQIIAIYAVCPDLRIVQDYTSDPDRLAASLKAFVIPPLPRAAGKRQPQTIDALVPPMLSALRDVVARISGASGRKSVVWISQAYGTELNIHAISGATDSTVDAFNDADVPLYAVDTRFSPTCEDPAKFGDGPRIGQSSIVTLTCSQPPDISDEWMEYLARATGGRAFSGGKVSGIREYDSQGKMEWAEHQLQSDRGLVSDALRFAIDESRYAYELGFYVPESELDGKVHTLSVTVPAKPKFELRYRSGYTASASATAPPAAQELTGPDSNQEHASTLNPDEVGIDATTEMAAGAKNELRVSLALAPETVTRAADGAIVLDATFTQTDSSGKQLAKIQETVRAPSPETQTDMVRYARALKVINGAVLLHIRIRDQATNRVGSITIPIEKQ
jgi:VWFA-related protein